MLQEKGPKAVGLISLQKSTRDDKTQAAAAQLDTSCKKVEQDVGFVGVDVRIVGLYQMETNVALTPCLVDVEIRRITDDSVESSSTDNSRELSAPIERINAFHFIWIREQARDRVRVD